MQNINHTQIKHTKIFALGGLEEVGKNTYCIEHNNEIIIIDAGIKFPDKSLFGVQYIIPDYSYLLDKKKSVKALFITHGHEDHIGAIPTLVKKINLKKIYSGKLASDLIRLKLKRAKLEDKVEVIEYDETSEFQISYFSFSFFRVTHSIPNSFGIAVKTPNGTVVTTGDFKIDLTPLGKKISFNSIQKIARDGVTLLLSDSTNSENSGYTPTEKEVTKNISNVFERYKSRIFITTFASNVDRIYEIINIAQKSNKKIMVFGRSIENIIKIVKNRNYLSIPHNLFIDRKKIKDTDPENLIIICTGSQGEPNSIVSRLSEGDDERIKPEKNDVLIFSSRPIPGNKYRVKEIINNLKKLKVKVAISSKEKIFHTSGHANKEGQKVMISLFQPTYFMPMHGDYRMLKIHGNTAMEVGIKPENVFICKNGDEIILNKGKARKKIGKLVAPVYISSGQNIELDMKVLWERGMMLKNGFVGTMITFDKNKKRIMDVGQINFIGIPSNRTQKRVVEKLIEKILNQTINENFSDQIKKKVETIIENFFFEEAQITPLIQVEVFSV